jgi:hypothetical protein
VLGIVNGEIVKVADENIQKMGAIVIRTRYESAEVATSGEKSIILESSRKCASGLFCLLLILVHNICY